MDEISKFLGFKKTIPFVVSKDVYNAFQKCSCDFNPLHTNVVFARLKGFKECVMYGNILNAFVSCAIGEQLPSKNVIIHSQDIQYKNPFFLNDKLEMFLEVEDIHESVNVIELKFKFLNEQNVIVSKGHIQIGILL
jgi:Acyl dehydratase